MAKQSRDRSASSNRANVNTEGGGENRRRSRAKDRSQSEQADRRVPSQPARKLCMAYKAGSCKDGTKCQFSHDVAAWLKWRDFNFAAKGGDD
eukprot:7060561-Prorocentrum_lima.AAC.1